jgi:hypothetical protein
MQLTLHIVPTLRVSRYFSEHWTKTFTIGTSNTISLSFSHAIVFTPVQICSPQLWSVSKVQNPMLAVRSTVHLLQIFGCRRPLFKQCELYAQSTSSI